MGFGLNYDEVGEENTLLPAGEYEFLIKNAELRTAKSGIAYIWLMLVIRNDVEQKYKNKVVFESMFKKKEPTPADNCVEGFSYARLMSMGKSSGLEHGKTYKDLNEFLTDLINKPVKCSIIHDTYNGNTKERIKYFNETSFKNCKHVFKDNDEKQPASNQTQQTAELTGDLSDFVEILNDGDVPF